MDPTAAQDPLLLPVGSRLVHIGPHKTGTTAIQAALWTARPALLAQGIRHVGRSRNPAAAVSAVIGRSSKFIGGAVPPAARWRELVREVRTAREPRIVLSSEVFADAHPDAVRTIVEDLDRSRIQVVVTLRPLVRILPSQWQQYVQHGSSAPFERWLDAMFNQPGSRLTPSFWQRHRHDRLVERWAEAVGPSRVTVVALDDADRRMVLRTFERLTGLREGTLQVPVDLANRSMTLPEIEAVRAFNVAFKAAGLEPSLLSRAMTYGAAQHLKRQAADPRAPRIEVPPWARARSAEVSREMIAAIAASGVRVVGDLAGLVGEQPERPDGNPGQEADDSPAVAARAAVEVSPEVAARLSMGVVIAAGLARDASHNDAAAAGLDRVPTYVLRGVVLERLRQAVADVGVPRSRRPR